MNRKIGQMEKLIASQRNVVALVAGNQPVRGSLADEGLQDAAGGVGH